MYGAEVPRGPLEETQKQMRSGSTSSPRRHTFVPGGSLSRSGNDPNQEALEDFERRDDEIEGVDRGEALIIRRARERKREKRAKQRELEQDASRSVTSEGGDHDAHAHGQDGQLPERQSQQDPLYFGGNTAASVDGDTTMQGIDGDTTAQVYDESADGDEEDIDEDLEFTLKDRQDALNLEHPFGLPIWKPALYKKERSITRTADNALRCTPGLERPRLLLGNFIWSVLFGVWIGLVCLVLSGVLRFVPRGGDMYSHVLYGLALYIVWPFGNYVEAECSHAGGHRHGSCRLPTVHEHVVRDGLDDVEESQHTMQPSENTTLWKNSFGNYGTLGANETEDMTEEDRLAEERGVYHYVFDDQGNDVGVQKRIGGIIVYGLLYTFVLFPVLGIVCLLCWSLVVTVPMAKLTWVLLKNLAQQPLALHFRSPWQIDTRTLKVRGSEETYQLRPGVQAPRLKRKHRRKGTGKRRSVILLCTYRAMGHQYFKYTVGGVNILFVNTVPIVFLTILLFYFVRPIARAHKAAGLLGTLCSDGVIFALSLASVLPLSYFIGMAVASISTQSSIGMGAVINATFGSIIEIVLYSAALMEGKAQLVEGSLIGSILAGVLFMPGLSMMAGAVRRKEQRFNARSAGVTSTMLIMAIIGILTPTLFYQIYGNFELECIGCPADVRVREDHWRCERCSYEHIPAVDDPFYKSHVEGFVYVCAIILTLAYAIGLLFSLRTHASQIWNTAPQPAHDISIPNLHRASVYRKIFPPNYAPQTLPVHHQDAQPEAVRRASAPHQMESDKPVAPNEAAPSASTSQSNETPRASFSPPTTMHNKNRETVSQVARQATQGVPEEYVNGAADRALSDSTQAHANKKLSTEALLLDAVARTYQYIFNQQRGSSRAGHGDPEEQESNAGGGHEAPSWSRAISLSVLLSCTLLYSIIAEIIVDLVDVVSRNSGLSEKFVGVTLFALVPNTTEFMNAISFAVNGNIALALEISSAYVLQVCLIQIPFMVGFSALYNMSYDPKHGIELSMRAFTLIFPRWDVIAIILSIFLLTYTYNESRSNYHRGSILTLSYFVFMAGFYFAPSKDPDNLVPGEEGFRRWPA